ncbi:MAG TPA: hypothetical protein VHG72_21735 [Polyangia bacterium]|nr:hypothetical protein [Polyangia bacterium]
MIAQHRSATNEHYSPALIVEPARKLLGHFDLDPASCAKANRVIQAATFFSRKDDGLRQPWFGRVFLNPPGGKLKRVGDRWVPVKAGPGKSSMAVWWDYLVGKWKAGRVERAIFVAFTLEILRSSQACSMPVQAFPRCYPKERLRFGGDQPTHGNVLVYLPRQSRPRALEAGDFKACFAEVGYCEGGATL